MRYKVVWKVIDATWVVRDTKRGDRLVYRSKSLDAAYWKAARLNREDKAKRKAKR